MTEVRAHDGESIESLIRRFTKKMTNSGVMQDAKAKQEFTKPSDLVRKAKAASKSRIRKHQKKMEQQADYENNNKFRPRRPGPQFPRPDNQDNRNSQDNRNNPNNPNNRGPRPQEAKVQAKPTQPQQQPISDQSLKDLQNKFKASK